MWVWPASWPSAGISRAGPRGAAVASLSTLTPFAAVTDFVDPAVDFSLKFHASAVPLEPEEHEEAENDAPAEPKGADDGSNVVSVDFTRKK